MKKEASRANALGSSRSYLKDMAGWLVEPEWLCDGEGVAGVGGGLVFHG